MALKQIAATALTASDATAVEEPGSIRVEATGKMYRYIRNCGSKTLRKGAAVNLILKSANYYQVCCSRKGSSMVAGEKNAFAGVLTGSVRKGHYGWAQFRGNFLGTSLRSKGSGAHIIGTRFGLASGQVQSVQLASQSKFAKYTQQIGVVTGVGSLTFMKGVYLYGGI